MTSHHLFFNNSIAISAEPIVAIVFFARVKHIDVNVEQKHLKQNEVRQIIE